ncbi:ISAzo13-like element transposase-related protein [Micromonospora sp. RTP1Z1]|uniref:ISAzo13-like element transposase-related protein n=1 Tax=Micromonospora sp. RTP1Z1 TaxID=2994043 RepID=UPI0039B585B8
MPSFVTSTSRSNSIRPPVTSVVSIDSKKKELVGPYHNGGREWQPQGQPVQVRQPRLPGCRVGQGHPVRDLRPGGDTGWVNVGTDHDTAAFAVVSLRRWWEAMPPPSTRRPPDY